MNTLKSLIALKADACLSGHNDPLSSQDLQGLVASIEEKQGKVKAMIAEGKSLEELKKSFWHRCPAGPAGQGELPEPD